MNRDLHSKASCYFNFFDLIRQDAKNSLRAISSAKHSAIMKIPRVLRASLRLCGLGKSASLEKKGQTKPLLQTQKWALNL